MNISNGIVRLETHRDVGNFALVVKKAWPVLAGVFSFHDN